MTLLTASLQAAINNMNIESLFYFDASILSALEVKCEDLEFERDAYLDFIIRMVVGQAIIQIMKDEE